MTKWNDRTRPVPTYIEGFDEALRGGVPHQQVVLISGTAGTMKSSLAYSILYHNAEAGRRGLYISLEQTGASLQAQMREMGLPLPPLAERMKLFDLSAVLPDLEALGEDRSLLLFLQEKLVGLRERFQFDLLALDSLDVLVILSQSPSPRAEMFEFFEWLRDLHVTSFLIAELSPRFRSESRRPPPEQFDRDFLADGIIFVDMNLLGGVEVRRRIRCLKMRSVNHNPNYFNLRFDEGWFSVAELV